MFVNSCYFLLKVMKFLQMTNVFDVDMTDSSSQSDDTSGGGGSSNGGMRTCKRNGLSNGRRKKGVLSAKDRNLRRLESNERERMRMHSLNDAFQVRIRLTIYFS